ncbi:hypothetical protein [Prosthecobacter sp.]|jgi:hypothetical protein|uniref:hypothetical protein n=1 Tax=Prosthecobacter sp. TaxID=1965333 RepID=UPI003784C6E5
MNLAITAKGVTAVGVEVKSMWCKIIGAEFCGGQSLERHLKVEWHPTPVRKTTCLIRGVRDKTAWL